MVNRFSCGGLKKEELTLAQCIQHFRKQHATNPKGASTQHSSQSLRLHNLRDPGHPSLVVFDKVPTAKEGLNSGINRGSKLNDEL